MPTLDDIYRKFGEVAEAAQIVETDLGTMMLFYGVVEAGLISPTLEVDSAGARNVLERVNRQTLGQLLKNAENHTHTLDMLEPLLTDALQARDRLSHSFYREHNFRKNTEAGRAIMMADLEAMHATLLEAMKALSLLSGIDLGKMVQEADAARARGEVGPPVDDNLVFHVPI